MYVHTDMNMYLYTAFEIFMHCNVAIYVYMYIDLCNVHTRSVPSNLFNSTPE